MVRVDCSVEVREVTIRDSTAAATALAGPETAVIVVRWKPSARSRSLSGISALSAPPAQIGPAQATTAFGPRPRLALPVRQDMFCGDGYRPFSAETAGVPKFPLAD